MQYYTEQAARELVLEAGLRLQEEGLVSRTWGNVSARISGEEFVITPSGIPYDRLTAADMVKVRISDCSYEGTVKPSSEKGVHAAVYALREEAAFVIHTHQFYASVVGIRGKKVGSIPCAGYGLPGTGVLKRRVARCVRRHPEANAFLMRRHGALCVGPTLEEAFRTARNLEERCEYLFRNLVKVEEEELPGGGETQEVRVTDRYTCSFSRQGKTLAPYLDDFAQIAGVSVRCAEREEELPKALIRRDAALLKDRGGVCTGPDASAVAEILSKNCAAALYAQVTGGCLPMGAADALLQRFVYLKKYSKLATEEKA